MGVHDGGCLKPTLHDAVEVKLLFTCIAPPCGQGEGGVVAADTSRSLPGFRVWGLRLGVLVAHGVKQCPPYPAALDTEEDKPFRNQHVMPCHGTAPVSSSLKHFTEVSKMSSLTKLTTRQEIGRKESWALHRVEKLRAVLENYTAGTCISEPPLESGVTTSHSEIIKAKRTIKSIRNSYMHLCIRFGLRSIFAPSCSCRLTQIKRLLPDSRLVMIYLSCCMCCMTWVQNVPLGSSETDLHKPTTSGQAVCPSAPASCPAYAV